MFTSFGPKWYWIKVRYCLKFIKTFFFLCVDPIGNLKFWQHFTWAEIRFQFDPISISCLIPSSCSNVHFFFLLLFFSYFHCYLNIFLNLDSSFIHLFYPSYNKYWLFVNTYFIIFYHFASVSFPALTMNIEVERVYISKRVLSNRRRLECEDNNWIYENIASGVAWIISEKRMKNVEFSDEHFQLLLYSLRHTSSVKVGISNAYTVV
jgi:hypothetical protein